METTLYWYGPKVNEKDTKMLTDTITTVFVDMQNLESFQDILIDKGFTIVEEGYELTSHNDLYQFKFLRSI